MVDTIEKSQPDRPITFHREVLVPRPIMCESRRCLYAAEDGESFASSFSSLSSAAREARRLERRLALAKERRGGWVVGRRRRRRENEGVVRRAERSSGVDRHRVVIGLVALFGLFAYVAGFAPLVVPSSKFTSSPRLLARAADAAKDVGSDVARMAPSEKRPRPPGRGGGGRGGRGGGGSGSRSHSWPPPPSSSRPKRERFDAARAFNSRLTTCDDASGLLSAFVERASSSPIKENENEVVVSRSAATHLAGAGRINSVNFSTCLHRLAKIVSSSTPPSTSVSSSSPGNSDNGDVDHERKRARALLDPRFALLVCSMAEMACGVDPKISVREGNDVLAGWSSFFDAAVGRAVADDDEMDEADDVLDAIANGSGVISNARSGRRRSSLSTTTSSSRASLARDAMTRLSSSSSQPGWGDYGPRPFAFTSRECSNVCWALAKLRLAPPGNGMEDALPVGRVASGFGEDEVMYRPRQFVSVEEMSMDVLRSAMSVRMKLFDEARNRGGGGGIATGPSWIPELSRLAGKVLDLIAVRVIDDYASRSSSSAADGYQNGGSGGDRAARANAQEMASILWAFAKVRRGDDEFFDTVATELMRQTTGGVVEGGVRNESGVIGPKPQELSNTIWAFATAGIRSRTQVELVKFIADALDAGDGQFFGHQFKPQERSNTAWALATLHSKRNGADGGDSIKLKAVEDDGIVRNMRWVAKSLVEHVRFFKPQELSNSVWAFSTVGFGYDESCGTNSHNDYVHVATDDPAGDKAITFEALEVIAENALTRLDKFKAQELNNLVWGFARLGHKSERAEMLFIGVAKELSKRTWQFKPQDIGTTLWSLATAGCFDFGAFRAGASRLNLRQIRSFKPQEMSNTIWALATAGIQPEHSRAFDTTLVPSSQRPTKDMITQDHITECFAAVAGEAMRRPQDFKDQELKDVLWSFSKAGVRHPSLFQKVAKHLVGSNGRGLSTFSSQGLGNTLWSYAKQAQLSLEVIETLGDSVKLVSTGRLAVYETSCLDNGGEAVITRLFARAAEAGMRMGLGRFTNQDLSNTVWAYSTLGILHSGFFKEVENEVVSRLRRKGRFRGQEIANIVWSFATLNAQPELSMVDALSSYVAEQCRGRNGIDEYSIARMFGQRQELANLAWSCAVIGRYPKDLMDIAYKGLLGTSNNPEQMKKVFNDDGLQKSSIMTLYYVQVAADVEAPGLVSLPEGFPNGWGEDEDCKRPNGNENDLIQISSSMLTLTVSKLQKAVSSTFNKIGFDSVLEHVIDASEIDDERGIQLPHSPKQFLSIDIANVEKRIGIEVDGPGHFVRLIDDPDKLTHSDLKQEFQDRGKNRVNGPTILKHRLLTHLGWDIIHLPYWEFQELAGDTEREMRYCQSLLEKSNNL